MIVKKIKAKAAPSGSGVKSKAAHITDLTDYLCQGERRGAPVREGEEVLYVGAQGFAWDDSVREWQKQMIALATAATRSKNPVTHYMMSWQEGERPTEKQVDEAVRLFMKELGLEGHQVVYGLHRDTDNVHLHLAVNRVHPVTEKPVKINRGFDIEAAHQAIARIEHAQGWRRERRGRYQIDEQSQVVRREAKREQVPEQVQKQEPAKPSIDGAWLPSARRRVQQSQTPTQSAPREQGDPRVIAAAAIREAEGWQQLHEQLAKRGMRYERKGSGALVWLGEHPMKASEVDRGASLGQLQKRLGEYQPAAPHLRVGEPPQRREPGQRARDAEHYTGEKSAQRVAIEQAAPVIREATGWQQLHEQLARREMRYERKGSGAVVWVGNVRVKASAVSREASFKKLERRLGEYVPARGARPAARRPEPMQPKMPRWQEYRVARQAHYRDKDEAWTELKDMLAGERKQLLAAQRQQRTDLYARSWKGKGDLLNAMRSVLAAEQAAAKAKQREAHRQLRQVLQDKYQAYPGYEAWLRSNQEHELADQWRYRSAEPARVKGPEHVAPAPQDIRAFAATVRGALVDYRREGGPGAERVAFTDRGQQIDIHAHQDKAAVRAALQLGAQKWGPQLTVWGNARYLELCVQVAAEDGIRLQNPELAQRIESRRQELKGHSPQSNELLHRRWDALLKHHRQKIDAELKREEKKLAERRQEHERRLEAHEQARPGRMAWLAGGPTLKEWQAEKGRLLVAYADERERMEPEHRRIQAVRSDQYKLAIDRAKAQDPQLAQRIEQARQARERAAREAAQRHQLARGKGRGRGGRGR